MVKTNHGTGLLDLYLYNPEAFADQRLAPSNILESRSLESLGIDLILNKKNPIVLKTFAQIEKWRTTSPILTEHLTKALQNLPFYYHQGYLANAPLEYFLPQNIDIPPSDLKMVAIYIKGFGVHIGFEDFRELPETHQIALVIHESLRLMKATGNFDFSNETLQKLTAEIMSQPKDGQSLDRPEYLHGKVLASLLEVAYLVKKAQLITNEICTNPLQQKNSALCSLNVEDASFEALTEMLSDYFIFLYGHADRNSNNKKKQNLVNDLYLFIVQTENLRLKGILNETTYVGSYMDIRSRSMEIDSIIDIENSYGLKLGEAAKLKKYIDFFLQDAKVEHRNRK